MGAWGTVKEWMWDYEIHFLTSLEGLNYGIMLWMLCDWDRCKCGERWGYIPFTLLPVLAYLYIAVHIVYGVNKSDMVYIMLF